MTDWKSCDCGSQLCTRVGRQRAAIAIIVGIVIFVAGALLVGRLVAGL